MSGSAEAGDPETDPVDPFSEREIDRSRERGREKKREGEKRREIEREL